MTDIIRILVIDDNIEIHQDFIKVLNSKGTSKLELLSAKLFHKNNSIQEKENDSIEICTATQGQEGIDQVKESLEIERPFSVAFVDIRMPPGLDGIETIKQMWQLDSNIQIVLCTAYSDYSFEEIGLQLKEFDNFLILKKPFDAIEIRQLCLSLSQKWKLKKETQRQLQELKDLTFSLENSLSINKSTLESTREAIIVISKNKEIITYNMKFLEFFDISYTLLTKNTEQTELLIEHLANQIEDVELFTEMINSICTKPRIEKNKELKLKSGKFLELYAQPHNLHNQIIGSVFSFRDITERKNLELELIHHATHDGLTNLPNRVLLLDRIQQAIKQAKRLKRLVGILLIDLDNFKEINDTFGHPTGDILLQSVAKKLKISVREIDTVARLGGDEFVIILASSTKEEQVNLKAKDLLKTIAEDYQIENDIIMTSASIGISIFPQDGSDAETLLKNADIALS